MPDRGNWVASRTPATPATFAQRYSARGETVLGSSYNRPPSVPTQKAKDPPSNTQPCGVLGPPHSDSFGSAHSFLVSPVAKFFFDLLPPLIFYVPPFRNLDGYFRFFVRVLRPTYSFPAFLERKIGGAFFRVRPALLELSQIFFHVSQEGGGGFWFPSIFSPRNYGGGVRLSVGVFTPLGASMRELIWFSKEIRTYFPNFQESYGWLMCA